MDPITIGLIAFATTLLLLAIRIPIAFALIGVATATAFAIFAFRSGTFMPDRAWAATSQLVFTNAFDLIHSFDLSMIPLFIALGNVAYRAGITTAVYNAARVWMQNLRGGIAAASVVGCGGFSAITGSSIACASTMGKICTPEMLRLGYDPRLATASVAAGGTLGSLIPPSVLFIIYAIFTETSVNKLFIAGVLPGILTLIGFLLVIYVWIVLNPSVAPGREPASSWGEKLDAMRDAWPAALIFLIVFVGIYGGFFTATSAAAVSVVVTTIIGFAKRTLDLKGFWEAIRETCVQTTAIFFVAAGAKIFVAATALTGVAPELVQMVSNANPSLPVLLFCICLVYLVLGMFLDPIGIMVLTLPLLVPLVEAYGLNLIWFGVVVVKLLEIGLITPPVGLNVFVLSNVVGKAAPIGTVFAGIWRFLCADIVVLFLIVAFPAISLVLSQAVQ
ncbi:C4-dicarboxylate ABC transporter [Roseobacter cerasinus]|uniref:TRAP transporter large permease protein n=1 Tax=Roseobacter cerasinus TaxID=2602289 RepID=A0A640VWM7_9RHOB|nr:TRAP transporter large permease [Roseobacter cerasinus]GFE52429.1 C4-dicarboxylate ABC transporter [Roseobacter cerasinus]